MGLPSLRRVRTSCFQTVVAAALPRTNVYASSGAAMNYRSARLGGRLVPFALEREPTVLVAKGRIGKGITAVPRL